MDLFLCNPHQIRSHGYSLCDNPWDPHRTLGLGTSQLAIYSVFHHRFFNSFRVGSPHKMGIGYIAGHRVDCTTLEPIRLFHAQCPPPSNLPLDLMPSPQFPRRIASSPVSPLRFMIGVSPLFYPPLCAPLPQLRGQVKYNCVSVSDWYRTTFICDS
jgi:hypothetical protein